MSPPGRTRSCPSLWTRSKAEHKRDRPGRDIRGRAGFCFVSRARAPPLPCGRAAPEMGGPKGCSPELPCKGSWREAPEGLSGPFKSGDDPSVTSGDRDCQKSLAEFAAAAAKTVKSVCHALPVRNAVLNACDFAKSAGAAAHRPARFSLRSGFSPLLTTARTLPLPPRHVRGGKHFSVRECAKCRRF